MSSGNTGGKAVPDNRTVNLSGTSGAYGSGGTVASNYGGGNTTINGGGYSNAPSYRGNYGTSPAPAPVATPITATPNYVDGHRSAFEIGAEAVKQMEGKSFDFGYGNPFAPTPGEALQRYLINQQIASQTALNGAHGNLLNAQQNNLNQQYGFNEREIGLKLANAGIDRNYIAAMRASVGQLKDLYGQQNANEIQGLNQHADVNRRDINSKATAAGAFLFPGRGQHIEDVNNDLANQTENANLSLRDKLINLDMRHTNELDHRNAKLDLIGQEVGLDRDKARAALDLGLANLGYDRYVDSNKLLDMLTSGKAQEQAIAQQIFERAAKSGAEYYNGNVGDQYAQHTTTRWGIKTGGN